MRDHARKGVEFHDQTILEIQGTPRDNRHIAGGINIKNRRYIPSRSSRLSINYEPAVMYESIGHGSQIAFYAKHLPLTHYRCTHRGTCSDQWEFSTAG